MNQLPARYDKDEIKKLTDYAIRLKSFIMAGNETDDIISLINQSKNFKPFINSYEHGYNEAINDIKGLAEKRICEPRQITISDNKKLPKELNTDNVKKLFNKAIEAGLCVADGELYEWKDKPSLFGYFVDVVSDFLNVRPSNSRLPWKIFKEAFKRSDKDVATAKQAVNDYKNKNQSEPEGFLIVKKLCK